MWTVYASVEQTLPSPTIPGGQAHANEPSVFVQYASTSHDGGGVLHSSTSTQCPVALRSKPGGHGAACTAQAHRRQRATPSASFPDKAMAYPVEQGKLKTWAEAVTRRRRG